MANGGGPAVVTKGKNKKRKRGKARDDDVKLIRNI